jgi:hypothetical protein
MKKSYETIIIGAGISGLACAQKLQECNKDFLIISKDIGGRILTSSDGKANYGAFFVCSDYDNVLNYVKLKYQIKLSDFCFHKNNATYLLYQPRLLRYLVQFNKIKRLLYKFRKSLRNFRIKSVNISQKKAIEEDPFLYELYMQDAVDFVKKHNISKGTDDYLSQALYSTTFSKINEMNAFSFLQFLIPLITPIYTFEFEIEKMTKSFKDKIKIVNVKDIVQKKDQYKIITEENIFYSKNLVLATEITWSKKFAGVNKTNKPISTNMLHIKGEPRKIISKKVYQLFTPPNNVQAIADLKDGTYLFYYKKNKPNLEDFFYKPKIINHHLWDPAGTINGHNLIESYKCKNMYLIGDYNIAGLEESFITGLYAANQIIKF